MEPEDRAIVCATNVAILHLINEVPTQPSANPLSCTAASRPGPYSLRFEDERHLCSTLAFLSSLKNDPEQIPALCIQDNPQTTSLKVLVAVNAAKSDDGGPLRLAIKTGLDRIFALLKRDPQYVEDQVFDAIITMCSERIMERLRFTGKAKNDQRVIELLQGARHASQGSVAFRQNIADSIRPIKEWRRYQTTDRLKPIVKSLYCISQVENLQQIFGEVTDRELSLHPWKHLSGIVGKVSRYYVAAKYLVRMAKKHTVMKSVSIVPVSLPEDAFFRPSAGQLLPDLSLVLRGLGISPKQRTRFWRIMGVDENKARVKVDKQRDMSLRKSKIHAEIQLIYYIEQRPDTGPWLSPRVLASNKDACYLCNAFITAHGKFHTPKCHGRLYPQWRIPYSPSIGMERRFLDDLENNIRNGILDTLRKNSKLKYLHPCESTILTPMTSRSTLAITAERGSGGQVPHETNESSQNEASPEADFSAPAPGVGSRAEQGSGEVEGRRANAVDGVLGAPGQPDEVALASTDNEQPSGAGRANPVETDRNILVDDDESSADETGSISPETNDTSPPEAEDIAPPKSVSVLLPRGRALDISVQGNKTSTICKGSPLHLHIEGPDRPGHKAVQCQVHWLDKKEAEIVRKTESLNKFDAESLSGDMPICQKDQDKFYICGRGAVLQVCISWEGQ